MRKLTLGLALLVAAATSAACSKKVTADDCETFADHMVELTLKEMTGALPPPRPGMPSPLESAKQTLRGQRGSFVTQCNALPRAAYDCIMKADSVGAMTAACATAK